MRGEGRQGCGSGTTWKSILGGFALEERGKRNVCTSRRSQYLRDWSGFGGLTAVHSNSQDLAGLILNELL